MPELICKILKIGKTTYYKYLKQKLPIMIFLQSFTRLELLELLESGKIEKFNLLNEMYDNVYNELVIDIENFDIVQRQMLKNIIDSFLKKYPMNDVENFIFFIQKSDLEIYFPNDLYFRTWNEAKQIWEKHHKDAIKELDKRMHQFTLLQTKETFHFLFNLNKLQLLVFLANHNKIFHSASENNSISMPTDLIDIALNKKKQA